MQKINQGQRGDEALITMPHDKQVSNVVHKKYTNKEFRFNATIGNFDINNVNNLPKKKWEKMGKQKMVWSPIQIQLENQHKIYPIGRMKYFEVDIDGVKTKEKIVAIEIIDDTKSYSSLLGIDWDFIIQLSST